jgi:formylglycine-generating enzyme required for sulfatase activity
LMVMVIGCVNNSVDLNGTKQKDSKCPEGMIYIPAGAFIMGNDSVADQSPSHQVTLEAYCIDKYEFSNVRGSRPVNGLNYYEAEEKCLNAGKRLCTESEWEHACRGNGNNIYPWGNKEDFSRCYIGEIGKFKSGTYDMCYSEFGVFDMSGGVWEWTSEWYESYPGKLNSFSEIGSKKVLRGGYWLSSFELATCSSRFPMTVNTKDIQTIGFRCCKSIDDTRN